MSKEISVTQGAHYIVTPTVDGTVTTVDGKAILTFFTGEQSAFFVPVGVEKVIVSDDAASVDRNFDDATLTAAGGGRRLKEHLDDTVQHLSAAEREQWNAAAPQTALDAHEADSTKHLSAAEREQWNAAAPQTALDAHEADGTKHLSAAERAQWNAAAPQTELDAHEADSTKHLSAAERAQWNAAAPQTALDAHEADGTKHITEEERAAWNAGFSESTLAEHVLDAEKHLSEDDRAQWNAAAPQTALVAHEADTEKHLSAGERAQWNAAAPQTALDTHEADAEKHLSAAERSAWNAAAALIPVGTLLPSACDSMEGYLLCDGSLVSRASYAALYAVLGDKYAQAGDADASLFRLPDFRGRTLWGADAEQALGNTIDAGLPEISGALSHFTGSSGAAEGAIWHNGVNNNEGVLNNGELITFRYPLTEYSEQFIGEKFYFNASKSNAIYGASDTVQPPAIAVNIFIKY